MKETNKNIIFKRVISFVFIIASLFGYFYLLEFEKKTRIENNILAFQFEYKDYLTKDNNVDLSFLEKLAKTDLLKSSALAEHYNKLKKDTFKNFRKEYLSQVYEYNFLKNENTTNYDKSNSETFNKLVSETDELVQRLEDDYDISTLNKLKVNKDILLKLVRSELQSDTEVIREFKNAKNNIGTSNTMQDGCFKNQSNNKWIYDQDSSRKLCYQLGLNNCAKLFTVNDEINNKSKQNLVFNGYTLNNPRKVSKKFPYIDFVSFEQDDFKNINKFQFSKIKDKYVIYPEVYTQKIKGRIIYKYNVIGLPNDYELSCKIPK